MVATCLLCGKLFVSPSKLALHMRRKNPCVREGGVKCGRCNRTFCDSWTLGRHTQACSQRAKQYEADHLELQRICQSNNAAMSRGPQIVNNSYNDNSRVYNTINVNLTAFSGDGVLQLQDDDVARLCMASRELQSFLELSEVERVTYTPNSPCAAFLTDMIKQGHRDPNYRNIKLDSGRSDHVQVHQGTGVWITKTVSEAVRTLADQANTIVGNAATVKNLSHPRLGTYVGGLYSMRTQYEEHGAAISAQMEGRLIPHLKNLRNPYYMPE